MTLKEKVADMEPGKISETPPGEIDVCPWEFDYLNINSKICPRDEYGGLLTCAECWNREFVPEDEEIEKVKLIERLEDLCELVPFTDCWDCECPLKEKCPFGDDCEWSVENNTAEGIKNQIRTLEAYLKMRDEADKATETTKTPSAIDHPSHYNKGNVECIDAIKAATVGLNGFEGFCAGNAIKYLFRWKHKNGVEDLKKSQVYIDWLIEEQGNE